MKIVCIDFDGVLHSYDSGWKGPANIPDAPTPGAFQWLLSLCDDPEFEPAIYSSRSRYYAEGAVEAMKDWLFEHGFPKDRIKDISFPTEKPAAFLMLDDRAMRFAGVFPSLEQMRNFKPWNKGGETSVEEAVRTLTTALRDDPSFYLSYQSNIAVAIQDIFDGHVSPEDLHKLSNKAAMRFMSWWGCGDCSGE